MKYDHLAGACVDGGWFEPIAYMFNLAVLCGIVYLSFRNARALSSENLASEWGRISFRLLVTKRLTQVLGLFCAFQLCNFLAYTLFILALPDSHSESNAFLAAMTCSYKPIRMTFSVLATGMTLHAILDAVLRWKMLNAKLPQPGAPSNPHSPSAQGADGR